VHTSLRPVEPHANPGATHVLCTDEVSQHPPPVHWLPWQHGSPVEPHGTQVVPLHVAVPPEHCSPSNRHSCVVGSQQPPLHAMPVVQHGSPLYPQETEPLDDDTTPDELDVDVLPHVPVAEPEIDCVLAPCVHVIVQLEPLAFDEQVTPDADSVPQRHSDWPPWLTVQQPPFEPDEHAIEMMSARRRDAPRSKRWLILQA
jgi:hypothetical protein